MKEINGLEQSGLEQNRLENDELENNELEQVIERAHHELKRGEFNRALHHAVAEGEKAGRKEAVHWLVALLLGLVLIVAVTGDARIIFIAPLLFAFWLAPFMLAGYTTARREREKEDLIHTIHDHDHPPT